LKNGHQMPHIMMTSKEKDMYAPLYKVSFKSSEAFELRCGLDLHYTPKHGSWLNIAEIEVSVFKRFCLCRRIPDMEMLGREVEAWTPPRNAVTRGVDWRFTTENAHLKLKRLYPQFETG